MNFQVVGIDIAGDEGAIRSSGDSEVFTDFDKEIFRKAKNLGIHRTVHAGEDGPSANVKVAVEEMFAERIGELKITIYFLKILRIFFPQQAMDIELCKIQNYIRDARIPFILKPVQPLQY